MVIMFLFVLLLILTFATDFWFYLIFAIFVFFTRDRDKQ